MKHLLVAASEMWGFAFFLALSGKSLQVPYCWIGKTLWFKGNYSLIIYTLIDLSGKAADWSGGPSYHKQTAVLV